LHLHQHVDEEDGEASGGVGDVVVDGRKCDVAERPLDVGKALETSGRKI